MDEKKSTEREHKDLNSQDQNKASGGPDAPFNMGVNTNASDFPNMMNMNMNAGFSNPMDYTQMMQYMPANEIGNFNNMMGPSSSDTPKW